MSAKGRGAVRIEADNYKTPKEAFLPLLPYLSKKLVHWEPACGDGRLIEWMQDAGITARGSDLIPRKQMGCLFAYEEIDFLKDETMREVTISNPPFSLAMEFCAHAVEHSTHEVWMLLRLNFLASRKRREWFRANEPSAIFVLANRPSFTEDGKNDCCDYGWYLFSKEKKPRWKGIFHL